MVILSLVRLYLVLRCIKNLLGSHHNFEVKFVKRQANVVAHMLAKAIDSYSWHSVFNMTPPYIHHLLTNDKN